MNKQKTVSCTSNVFSKVITDVDELLTIDEFDSNFHFNSTMRTHASYSSLIGAQVIQNESKLCQ